MARTAGSGRSDELRHLVELTGIGIAATYFLDAENGAARRLAARSWLAGKIATERSTRASLPLEVPPTPPKEHVNPEAARDGGTTATAIVREEISVPPSRGFDQRLLDEDDRTEWPRWGWPLVIAITASAVAAIAAIGVGIWAVQTTSSDTNPPTAVTVAPIHSAGLAVLADPTTQRIAGTATSGTVVLLRTQSGRAVLVVAGVGPPPPARVYRLWIENDRVANATGRLTEGSGVVTLEGVVPEGARVIVSEERTGASATAPRGPVVATVQVPS
jgi:hypothetical protein